MIAVFALLAGVYLLAGEHALLPFLDTIHHQPAIAYGDAYDRLQQYGPAVAVPLAVLLVFPAFLGVFIVLYPLALWLRGRAAFDAAPLLLIAGYAVLMVLAPIPAHGDPTELTQRPFALVYALVVTWTAAVLVARLSMRWVIGVSAAALVLVWPQSGLWGEFPKFSWGWNYFAWALDPGVRQAAAFLRHQGTPGDVFAVQGLREGWVAADAAIEIVALSGMPAYLARPYIHRGQSAERQWAAERRVAALRVVAQESEAARALARLSALGVRWYVVPGRRGPKWDPMRRLAVFADQQVAVYRTTSL
jgi:hypothetical protein